MNIVLEKIKHPVRVQQQINKSKKQYHSYIEDDSVCMNCNGKRKSIFEILDKKIRKGEIEELIKLKRLLDKKIQDLLQEENDNS